MISPSTSRKRKASALLDTDASLPSSTQSRITSYGRLSKAQALLAGKTAEKGIRVNAKAPAVTAITATKAEAEEGETALAKKRRIDGLLDGARTVESKTNDDERRRNEEGASGGLAVASQSLLRKQSRQESLKQTAPSSLTATSSPPKKSSTAARGQSLLERIRAKERQQACLPAPPSKAETQRRSAMERLVEIVPVLNFLTLRHKQQRPQAHHQQTRYAPSRRSHRDDISTSSTDADVTTAPSEPQTMKAAAASSQHVSRASPRPSTHRSANASSTNASSGGAARFPAHQRISLPLPLILQHLQTSLKNPISKDEATLSIELLARVIASSWCQMVHVGQITAVVLHRGLCPSLSEVEERIGNALSSSSSSFSPVSVSVSVSVSSTCESDPASTPRLDPSASLDSVASSCFSSS